MTRGTGFASADLDVGFFRDTRIKRLAREHADVFPIAALGYVGIVLHCWSVGERLPATDAWPDLVPWSDAAIAALKAVELLDRAGRVRPGAWQGWFGVAYARREERRQAGALGGKRKAEKALAQLTLAPSTATPNGLAQLQQDSSIATPKSYPFLPILPTESSTPTTPKSSSRKSAGRSLETEPRLTKAQLKAWASFTDPAWQPFKAAWLARGFLHPPFGEAGDDPDTSQRARLWRIAEDQPRALSRWVAEAPGKTAHEVIAYVFEQRAKLAAEVGAKEADATEVTPQKRGGLTPVKEVLDDWIAGGST